MVSLTGFSQSKVQLGLKFGMSRVGTFTISQNEYTAQLNPLIGIDAQWRTDQRFGIRAGLQSQTSSGKYYDSRWLGPMGQSVRWETEGAFSLTKFTAPVAVSYNFPKSHRTSLSFQIGLKPSFVVLGQDWFGYTRYEKGKVEKEITTLDLLDKSSSVNLRRFNGQVVGGFSFRLSSVLSASLIYSYGPNYAVYDNRMGQIGSGYTNNDLEFTITYFPKF